MSDVPRHVGNQDFQVLVKIFQLMKENNLFDLKLIGDKLCYESYDEKFEGNKYGYMTIDTVSSEAEEFLRNLS